MNRQAAWSLQRAEDAAHVEQAWQGETEAFGELVKSYQELVFRYVLVRCGGDEDVAKELAQESFVRAYERLATLNDPQKFGGWLVGIARHVVSEWRRSRRPPAAEPAAELPSPTPEPGSEERERRLARVEQALARLTEEDRTLLTLRYIQENSLGGLQRWLGIGPSALKMRLKRARERLARLFLAMEERA